MSQRHATTMPALNLKPPNSMIICIRKPQSYHFCDNILYKVIKFRIFVEMFTRATNCVNAGNKKWCPAQVVQRSRNKLRVIYPDWSNYEDTLTCVATRAVRYTLRIVWVPSMWV